MKKEELEKTELPAGITEEMITAAKGKYGNDKVKLIDLPLDDEGSAYKTVLATVPSRTVIGQYRRYSDTDPNKADQILVKACLLSHKEEVLADDGLFYGALSGIANLIPIRKAIIKNV
jgi:hypothetical protein